MKKVSFILYTIVILMIGSTLGGTLAYSFLSSAHVAFGDSYATITFHSKNTLYFHLYEPKTIKQIKKIGNNALKITIE